MELFRPLAGVNYNAGVVVQRTEAAPCFRPLAGVNYNGSGQGRCWQPGKDGRFRPLAGVNYNMTEFYEVIYRLAGFRPLAGVNYNNKEVVTRMTKMTFPSPCGGEL